MYLASAHRIAHAIEQGYQLSLHDLYRYKEFFRPKASHPNIRLGGGFSSTFVDLANHALRRLTRKNEFRFGPLVVNFDRVYHQYISGMKITELAHSGLLIHQGWSFRDKDALRGNIEIVRKILDFRNDYKNRAEKRFRQIKGDACHVIGVHVRRGDYAKFRNGQFFFDDSVYLRIASEAISLTDCALDKVVIAGFSNDMLVWPDSHHGARVVKGPGEWWDDLLCLSMCDLIIGPPSTFSGAASFMGDVPWFQIRDKMSRFERAMALPYMESGIRI